MEKDKYDDLVDAVYKHALFGNSTEVKFDFAQYRNNGTLAVMLNCMPEPGDMEYAEEGNIFCVPYATVTVNLPDSSFLPANVQFVDTNNLPDIGDWLVSNGIASPTDHICQSGYCTYQAYAFNIPEKIVQKTVECREDCIAEGVIGLVENSGLKPDESNERGDLYRLRAAGDYPNPQIIIYKGTDPEHLGNKPDVFLLAVHRTKGEQMWRLRNLPSDVRNQVADSIRHSIHNSPRIKR